MVLCVATGSVRGHHSCLRFVDVLEAELATVPKFPGQLAKLDTILNVDRSYISTELMPHCQLLLALIPTYFHA